MSNLEMCSVHNIQRSLPHLKKLEDGLFVCKPDSKCKGAKVQAPPSKIVSVEGVADEITDPTTEPIPLPPIENCDLCNTPITPAKDIDEHVRVEHGTLLEFCNGLVDKIPVLEKAAVTTKTLENLGHTVAHLAAQCDKGSEIFKHALDAQKQLQSILSEKFRDCKVYIFGSCVATGCWDGVGDVDFTLVHPALWDAGQWPDDEKAIVTRATRALRDAGFAYDELQPLVRTRVPIVKHETEERIDFDRLSNRANRTIAYDIKPAVKSIDMREVEQQFTNCMTWWESSGKRFIVQFADGAEALRHYMMRHDLILPPAYTWRKRWYRYGHRPSLFAINFDLSSRAHGVRNSWLLRAYMEQDHVVRCGNVFLKHWSKRSGVNFSMKGYITSYAVSLLWIYYLIQKRQVTFVPPSSISTSLSDKEKVTYLRMLPSNLSHAFNQDLGSLVAGFFRFYAIEFDWKRDVISVSNPNKVLKEQLNWIEANEVKSVHFRERVWYRFCIEDPFEENLNLGRHVSPIKLNKVRSEFLHAYNCLVEGHVDQLLKDRSSAIASLTCQRFLHRMMIGVTERMPVEKVIAQLRLADSQALAAFEVDNTMTSLFGQAGYKVRNGTIEVHDETWIPKTALSDIAAIDSALAEHPHLGVPATSDMRKNHLDLLYYWEKTSNRYFASVKDSHKFVEHLQIVQRIIKDNAESDENRSLRKDIETTFSNANIQLDETILAEVVNVSSSPAPSSSSNRPPSSNHPPVGKTVIRKDPTKPFVGVCSQCAAKGRVWPTTVPAEDNGSYCDPCWRAY